jgi:integrase/recombinase XerD
MTIMPAVNPDVEVYARHVPDCPYIEHKRHPKCECPKWLYIKNGRRRVTARTTSLGVAEARAQEIRDSQDPVKRELAELKQTRKLKTVLIADAIQKWLPSKARAESTTRIYRCTLHSMRDYLAAAHPEHPECADPVFYLHEITSDHLANWTADEWKDLAPGSRRLRRRHAVTFFRHCIFKMKWLTLDQDPTGGMPEYGSKGINPIVPFERDEYEAILAATSKYDRHVGYRPPGPGARTDVTGSKLHAFIQLMRWSGLAIRDAATLQRSRLGSDDVLEVSRAKTGVWITTVLPALVAVDLRNVSGPHPNYFFWNGVTKPSSVVSVWGNALRNLWPLVKWPGEEPSNPHSHQFRHTFAKEFLQAKQGDLSDLADLMGHTSTRTTEIYKAFVPDRARRLNQIVVASFAAQGAPGYSTKRKSVGRAAPGRHRKAQAK